MTTTAAMKRADSECPVCEQPMTWHARRWGTEARCCGARWIWRGTDLLPGLIGIVAGTEYRKAVAARSRRRAIIEASDRR